MRRQVEDDYRLDIAAIERLLRRCLDSSDNIHSNPVAPSNPVVANNPVVPSSPVVPSNPAPNSSFSADNDVISSFDSSPKAGTVSEWRTEPRTEPRAAAFPSSGPPEPEHDELVDSLRSIFAARRR